MAIQIEQIVQVMAPWMAIGVVLPETKMVDGHLYVKALKTDHRIFRLMVGSSRVRDSVQLSAKVRHTIDHLVTMRDNQRQLYIQSLMDDGDALEFDDQLLFGSKFQSDRSSGCTTKLFHRLPSCSLRWNRRSNSRSLFGSPVEMLTAASSSRME